jgi:photosystem I subunit 3
MAKSNLTQLAALLLGVAAASAVAVAFVASPPAAGAPRALRSGLTALGGTEPLVRQEELVSEGASQADAQEGTSGLRWLGAGLAAGLLLAASAVPQPAAAEIDFSRFQFKNLPNMVLCKDSKKFHKMFKNEIYKNQQRQKKYPQGSVIWKRFETKVAQVKTTEEAYGTRICGEKDGLPRTVASGEMNVRGSAVIPALMFLYTAGWIGWSGRQYLQRTQDKMKEIKIDVPLALTCMASGFAWPVASWQDIVNGKFVAKDTDIYTSGQVGIGRGW